MVVFFLQHSSRNDFVAPTAARRRRQESARTKPTHM